MNFLNFLTKVLETVNFPEKKRERFLEIFYQYYYVRLIDELGGIDPSIAQRLTTAIDNMKNEPEQFGALWKELMGDEQYRAKIEEVTDEVLGYLMDDIAKNATEAERQQVLQALSTKSLGETSR